VILRERVLFWWGEITGLTFDWNTNAKIMVDLSSLTVGIQLPPPDHPPFDDSVPHAPKRPSVLSEGKGW
jgi:hypothetical protein